MMDQDSPFEADPLGSRVAATPERTALLDRTDDSTDEDGTWTYRALSAGVDAVADRLHEQLPANPPTRRIGLAVRPRVPFVTTLYAALRLGVTVVPLDPAMADQELADRIDRVDPALLVCERESERACLRTDRAVVSVDDPVDEAVSPLLVRTPDDPHSGPPKLPDVTPADKQDAVILFTSGTTGRPKAVRVTLANLRASAIASAFRLGMTPSDRWLGCLPVHHMGGLAPVFRSVWYGTTLVLQGSFDVDRTRDLIRSEGITGVSLVPTQLKRLLDAGWSPPESLRTVLLGGAPADNDLLSRALAADVPVCPTYGLTETASQVATARPSEVAAHPGTVGQPLLWTAVTVVDDGDPVARGERGELVVDGPTVTPGYLDEDATAEAFGEHGLHTGDLGVRDADGRLRILGRVDDVINTGGELVSPADVVPILESHPEVADAAVVGLADREWGEQVAALVVPSGDDETALDTETLREYCRGQLSDYKLPKTVVTTDRLPRTDSGTVDREAVAVTIERRTNRS